MIDTNKIGKYVTNNETLSVSILIINFFAWYFPLHMFLIRILNELQVGYTDLLTIFGTYYLTITLFALVGTSMAQKSARIHTLLLVWILLGIFSSVSMLLLISGSMLIIYLVFIFIGVALGFGFPCCLAFFADSTVLESRGKVGGIIFFLAFLGVFLIGFLTMTLNFTESIVLFALWRATSLLFKLLRRKKKTEKEKVPVGYRAIFSEKSFILYFIPWITFCLVNFFVGPLQQYHWGIMTSSWVSTIEFGVAGLAALIGGYFSDIVGRKRIIILGYILLGLGYALLSILPENPISISVYAFIDGIAWGLFALMFFGVIWGDLAGNRAKEKYYLVGPMPFVISSYLWILIDPFAEIISISMSFSLASFFLFLAVIPLMYAPETLPEKVIRRRELKKYIEEAKRIREKYKER